MNLTSLPPQNSTTRSSLPNKKAIVLIRKLKVKAKADSGASKHFWRWCDKFVLNDILKILGPPVALPDGNTIRATEAGTLPLRNLSAKAREVQIFKGLASASLLSIGQLCDDGCEVTLTEHKMVVRKNNDVILTGQRNYIDGLWDVELDITLPQQNTTTDIILKHLQQLHTSKQFLPCQSAFPSAAQKLQYKANVIIKKSQTKTELAKYLHATCWSPPPSTFINAIRNGNFVTWPGLTPALIRNHLHKSLATAKGHLDQEQKNLQSTKIRIKQEDESSDYAPSYHSKTQNCFAILTDFHELKKAYLDLTGKFPHKSSRGNQYFLVVYDYDSNAILVKPLKSRQAAEIREAWLKMHKKLALGGTTPELYIMDNEASTDLKSAMTKHKIVFQLVPPDMHRRNAAEKAIRAWKNHFIAGLSSLDPAFPITEWDRLIFQAFVTLNLLRNARANTKLSSYAYLFGVFDFNKTPMAPPGTKVLVHSKPSKRASWDTHGIEGWYVGPSMQHYRCVKCYMPETLALRDSDTVAFSPIIYRFQKSQQTIFYVNPSLTFFLF